MLITLTFNENDPRAIALIDFLRTLDFVKFLDNAVYEKDTAAASQVNEPAERYLTIDPEGQTEALRSGIVYQALKAEEEIREGKGLTAAEARDSMTAAELRKSLHAQLDGIEDVALLHAIEKLLHSDAPLRLALTAAQRKDISDSRAEVAGGAVIGQQDMDNAFSEWLKGA